VIAAEMTRAGDADAKREGDHAAIIARTAGVGET